MFFRDRSRYPEKLYRSDCITTGGRQSSWGRSPPHSTSSRPRKSVNPRCRARLVQHPIPDRMQETKSNDWTSNAELGAGPNATLSWGWPSQAGPFARFWQRLSMHEDRSCFPRAVGMKLPRIRNIYTETSDWTIEEFGAERQINRDRFVIFSSVDQELHSPRGC